VSIVALGLFRATITQDMALERLGSFALSNATLKVSRLVLMVIQKSGLFGFGIAQSVISILLLDMSQLSNVRLVAKVAATVRRSLFLAV
jgi:hypothetical protein